MLKAINGKIYVDDVETIDAELIGMAFKDFVEKLQEKEMNFDSGLISSQSKYDQHYAEKQREAEEIANNASDL